MNVRLNNCSWTSDLIRALCCFGMISELGCSTKENMVVENEGLFENVEMNRTFNLSRFGNAS